MKTTILSIAFAVAILCSSCTVKANPTTLITQPMNDEVESIIKEFKSGDNVTYVNLPKALIKLGLRLPTTRLLMHSLTKSMDCKF